MRHQGRLWRAGLLAQGLLGRALLPCLQLLHQVAEVGLKGLVLASQLLQLTQCVLVCQAELLMLVAHITQLKLKAATGA